jgi:hypothetical protein
METTELIEIIKADYAKFPAAQTYSIYSPAVYFKDPMYDFTGLGQYQKMIGFITTWFKNLRLELHQIEPIPSETSQELIKTRWTMSWDAPLPWKPRISISGWSELTIDRNKLIQSHIAQTTLCFQQTLGLLILFLSTKKYIIEYAVGD